LNFHQGNNNGVLLSGGGSGGVNLPNIPDGSHTRSIPSWFVFNLAIKIHNLFDYLSFITTPPDAWVIDLTTSYWKSEITYGLTKNGIFDYLLAAEEEEDEKEKGSTTTTTTTTATTTCNNVAIGLKFDVFVVCKIMEAGKNLHLLAYKPETKEYSLTPHGRLLTTNTRGNFKDFALLINEEYIQKAWRSVSDNLITAGDGYLENNGVRNSGFSLAYGENMWTYQSKYPKLEAQFDRAMQSMSGTPSGAFLSDWKPHSEEITFCDIGGGIGSMLGDVLLHYPKMYGIVFDRPEVVDRTRAYLKSIGLQDRAEAVAGSFLHGNLPDVLGKCDVFFLRFIVHDWPDEDNITILKNIHNVATTKNSGTGGDGDGKKKKKKIVVVMDQITSTGVPAFLETTKSLMTVNMIAANPYGSRERSIPEHIDLFQKAGYDSTTAKHIPLRTIHSLIEQEI
jgi:hypothetical protein